MHFISIMEGVLTTLLALATLASAHFDGYPFKHMNNGKYGADYPFANYGPEDARPEEGHRNSAELKPDLRGHLQPNLVPEFKENSAVEPIGLPDFRPEVNTNAPLPDVGPEFGANTPVPDGRPGFGANAPSPDVRHEFKGNGPLPDLKPGFRLNAPMPGQGLGFGGNVPTSKPGLDYGRNPLESDLGPVPATGGYGPVPVEGPGFGGNAPMPDVGPDFTGDSKAAPMPDPELLGNNVPRPDNSESPAPENSLPMPEQGPQFTGDAKTVSIPATPNAGPGLKGNAPLPVVNSGLHAGPKAGHAPSHIPTYTAVSPHNYNQYGYGGYGGFGPQFHQYRPEVYRPEQGLFHQGFNPQFQNNINARPGQLHFIGRYDGEYKDIFW